MNNPNIYVDFKPFQIGKYLINIRYTRQPTEKDKTNLIDVIDNYEFYDSVEGNVGYVHVVSDDFFGSARILTV